MIRGPGDLNDECEVILTDAQLNQILGTLGSVCKMANLSVQLFEHSALTSQSPFAEIFLGMRADAAKLRDWAQKILLQLSEVQENPELDVGNESSSCTSCCKKCH